MKQQFTRSTVELPPGVRHTTTYGVAESWGDYDALRADDGWQLRVWWVDRQFEACDRDDADARQYECLEALIRGHLLVVWPPEQPRENPVVHRVRSILEDSMSLDGHHA